MTVGTKSLLFGVHAFWFHPIVVMLAWRRRYKKIPNFFEALAIFFHDIGYFGCDNMDGPEGKLHPEKGAEVMFRLVRWFGETELEADKYYWLVLGHSRWMAKRWGDEPSALCNPDKESVLFDPRWFYLLRATLSGEIKEYKSIAIRADKIHCLATNREWFDWFRGRVAARAE